MIILSAFFFACMNVSVRLAGDLSSIQKSFFRNLVAAIFAAIILGKNHIVPKVQKQYWGALLLRCAFGTLGILCNFYAIDHLLVADASILNKLSPFFAIIFSFLILKEKITPVQGTCVLLAFIGCLFVVKPGFQNAALIPALIGVCGGLGAGIAYTWGERPDHCILLFCIFLPVCASVSDFRLYSDDRKTACDASDGGPFCSRRSVYDHSSIYVCTGR